MIFSPYSFSKLSCHKQCGQKFKFKYIDKIPEKMDNVEPLIKGSKIHKMLENYPEIPEDSKYIDIYNNFLKTKYKSILDIPNVKEEGIGLTENLEPVPYSKNVMFRGYIDYYTVIDGFIEEIIEVQSLDKIPDGYEFIEIVH